MLVANRRSHDCNGASGYVNCRFSPIEQEGTSGLEVHGGMLDAERCRSLDQVTEWALSRTKCAAMSAHFATSYQTEVLCHIKVFT